MYDYKVLEVLKVVDGDTVDLKIDVGFYQTSALRFRLLNVDTPERGQVGWTECTEFVREWLVGRKLVARTQKSDSFGRWLVWLYDADTRADLSQDVYAFMVANEYLKQN